MLSLNLKRRFLMRLKKLWIGHFKNLRDFTIDFENMDGLAVIIGNNGSGKSNFLEAISEIYASLYTNLETTFSYELIYSYNEEIDIHIDTTYRAQHKFSKIQNKKVTPIKSSALQEFLPSNVIASYSGEETRLLDKYFLDFYINYAKAIIQGDLDLIRDNQRMVYINKEHWRIALLSMLASDLSVESVLGHKKVATVRLEFDQKNLTRFNKSKANYVTYFIASLQDEENQTINLSIDEFKKKSGYLSHSDLYKNLSIAYLPHDLNYKLITKLELFFTDDTNVSDLSEGEKKQIIIKCMLRILANNTSLILLDEPDAHIHIKNKSNLKNLFFDDEGKVHANSIITTHSPTLTHLFEQKHIIMMNNGVIENRNKQEILSQITDGIWNYHEQSFFLSSTKDMILLVEGKHDKIHIEEAYKRLKHEYPDISFDIFSTDGANNLKQFALGFSTTDYDLGDKKVIAIFDDDMDGRKGMSRENFDPLPQNNQITKLKSNNLFFGFLLPKQDGFTAECTIEHMYPPEKYQIALNKVVERRMKNTNFFNNKSIDNISKALKDDSKNQLADDCKSFHDNDFAHFKKLFNLIREIKNVPMAPRITAV